VLARVDLVVWLMNNGADVHKVRIVNKHKTTPMHLAALCADERIVQHLLMANVSASVANAQHYLPCHFAAQNRNERVLALLLEANAPYNTPELCKDASIAHIAAANPNPAVIQLLIDHHVNWLVSNTQSLTPLHIAARDNRNERVLAALFAAVDLRDFEKLQLIQGPYRGKSFLSLLHVAAENENEAVLALVLAHVGAGDINAGDNDRCTPCFYAAANSNEKVIAMLLAAGADVRAPCGLSLSSSALCHQAARNSNDAVMAQLLAAGAAFHTSNIHGIYPVHVAARNKNERVLARLLAAGAEHFVSSSRCETVCMAAAKNPNEAVMKLLLALPDIDVDARNSNRETACQIAQACGNLGVVELLIGAGCKVDPATRATTLLWCADRKTARLWLRRGANVRAVNRNGTSLCLLAPGDVVPMLIAAGADVRVGQWNWFDDDSDRPLFLLAAGGNAGERAEYTAIGMAHTQEKTALALMLAVSADEDRVTQFASYVPEPLMDWAIENIRLRQFDLLQLRAAEVCIGLQSLELPALLLCEIAAVAFAPRECLVPVPFHKMWTIVTMVKHFKR
jgi:ankyrin repeat protein